MHPNDITVDDTRYFYKFTRAGALPIYGKGEYYKPGRNRPGKWHPKVKDLRICGSGYHVCETRYILSYIDQELYIVEVRGKHVEGDDKYAFEELRFIRRIGQWNEKTMRLFACDCAEHVLHIYEQRYPKDNIPRKAIEVTRKWIRGEVDEDEKNAARAAARDAARDAAWAAARDAARDAAWDADGTSAKAAAGSAARAAARAAAWDADGTSAKAAAWAAERAWQLQRFLQYVNGEIDETEAEEKGRK